MSELVSMADIAARKGVAVGTVKAWRHRYPTFPEPAVVLGNTLGWEWPTIARWLDTNGLPSQAGHHRRPTNQENQ